MRKSILFLLIFNFLMTLQVKSTESVIGHQIWDGLLKNNVTEQGKVNYQGFQKDNPQLDNYLKILSNNEPSETWTKNEKMAYWINAYNAFTIKLILDNWPLKSIMEINKGKAWDLKFFKIGNKMLSLNNIEHDILRDKYPDARIHFALNCTSISCPPLLNEAFTASSLENQLNNLTKTFVNNAEKNLITSNKVEISKLFDWYQDDFTKEGSLIDFLNKFSTIKISPKAEITYKDYNWNLNN